MISNKKHIRQLAALLLKRGITDVVISPGSRNAPLIHTFFGTAGFNCRNIVDERSAAYFATGLSLSRQKPVVIVCTSGTAPLNYSPAIAEAFYQHIPLIALTADRPDYWIDQAENQCIQQKDIYRNFTKKNVTLPLGESEKELWFAARQINECLNAAGSGLKAPVHINIPIEEPLHQLVEAELPKVKEIGCAKIRPKLSKEELRQLTEIINRSHKIMVLAGQLTPNRKLEKTLTDFANKTGAIVLHEHLSNMNENQFIGSIDTLMSSIPEENLEDYRPDLLISIGGQLVSKPIKQFLRKNKPTDHWHVSLDGDHFDTYQALTKVIATDAVLFFKALSKPDYTPNNDYRQRWKNQEKQINQVRDEFLQEIEFSDLKVFEFIGRKIPSNSVIHLGNSSPVRYALIHNRIENVEYYSNRGTAGIDGCLSTAVGFASESDKLNTVILGDLSFFYDSNALWNKYIRRNLRIIVIHNGGGNIFSMIKGPEETPAFAEHFFTGNTFKAEGLAKAFGLDYFPVINEPELALALNRFYSPDQHKAAILEVFTNAEVNSKVFRKLFERVKNNTKYQIL
jgi:2-succinyl-5-enolpyruvyl-6-hydroxy-3-cyclohexene-1-carboxylate synthase